MARSRDSIRWPTCWASATFKHDDFEMRHCEERSDEAIQSFLWLLDCFASLAITNHKNAACSSNTIRKSSNERPPPRARASWPERLESEESVYRLERPGPHG